MLNETILLALDTIELGKQAIIFAPSRASAEKTAEDIARHTASSPHHLDNQLLRATPHPTKQCRRLAHCLKKGIAFHHAGLLSSQRHIIESGFRSSNISIICSTPTLAAGVSLPAYRVIIKSLKRFSGTWGMDWIPVLEYLQMSGRAGRPEYERTGQAITIAKDAHDHSEIYSRYICGHPEKIYSKLAVEPVLRTYLLSLISSGIITNSHSLTDFFRKTFWAHQYHDLPQLQIILDKMISLLSGWQFISTHIPNSQLSHPQPTPPPNPNCSNQHIIPQNNNSSPSSSSPRTIFSSTQPHQYPLSHNSSLPPLSDMSLHFTPANQLLSNYKPAPLLTTQNPLTEHTLSANLQITTSPSTYFAPTALGKLISLLYLDPLTAHHFLDSLKRYEHLTSTRPPDSGSQPQHSISPTHHLSPSLPQPLQQQNTTPTSITTSPSSLTSPRHNRIPSTTSSPPSSHYTFSLLHMICSSLEMRPHPTVKTKELDYISSELNTRYTQILSDSLPSPDPLYPPSLSYLKTSLFLHDWLEEKDEEYILERYDIRPGEIYAKTETALWLSRSASELARLSNYPTACRDLLQLHARLKYGVQEELLELLKLSGIGRLRARRLYQHGFTSLQHINESPLPPLIQILGPLLAHNIKSQLNQPPFSSSPLSHSSALPKTRTISPMPPTKKRRTTSPINSPPPPRPKKKSSLPSSAKPASPTTKHSKSPPEPTSQTTLKWDEP